MTMVEQSYPNLETTKNTIVVGGVQVGKSQYIIDLITKILKSDKVPILIASDRLSVLDQYITRMSKRMIRKLKVINTNMDVTVLDKIYVAILSVERLKKIKELIYYWKDKQFVMIIDEGDLSIKDKSCALEKLQRKMDQCGIFLKRIFITATPFGVINSKAISTNIEEFIVLSSYKEGFVYRDYSDMIIHHTDQISDMTLDKKGIRNLSTFLKEAMMDKINQPNIGLLKIFHKNNNKHVLAKKLTLFMKKFNIIVYTGKGSTLYINGKVTTIGKQGSCIAQTIQYLKDFHRPYPILIISYNMASRSQTFKSTDHQWKLTHFFIDVPDTFSVEQTIQALRCNGQYDEKDSLVKVFVSKESHERITNLLYDNQLYINTCKTLFDDKINNMRDCIHDIHFVKVDHFKMSNRRGVDDTKVMQFDDGLCKNYQDAVDMAKILVDKNNCESYIDVTDQHFIISNGIILNTIQKYKYYDVTDQENIFTQLYNQFNHPTSFKGLTTKQQNLLRSIVLTVCEGKYNTIYGKSCQIGYYAERTKMLNQIHHKKHKQFKSRIVSEILSNGDISVMIYNEQYYIHPEQYDNKVLIWRDTQSLYHLCVNKPNATYSFISLQHK